MIQSIKTTPASVVSHFALKGLDVYAMAKDYVSAWVAKAEPGQTMTVAKMKCVLADGPCGCGPETPIFKCTGPYCPVPLEILKEVLLSGEVEGHKAEYLPAPEAIVVDGTLYVIDFVGPYSPLVGGPATALYVTKL